MWNNRLKLHQPYLKRTLIEGKPVEEELFAPRFSGDSEVNEQFRLIEFDCWLVREVFRRKPLPIDQEDEEAETASDGLSDPRADEDADSEERSVDGDLPTEADGKAVKCAGGGTQTNLSDTESWDSSSKERGGLG